MSLPLAYIIEDDEVIAKIFSTAVREAQFETVIIRDGIEAMEKLESNVPDLVVLDLHLPGISGINILRVIRNDPRFEKTRVLIASADATQSEFLRVNADQVLIKPIGFHKMREVAGQLRPNEIAR
jgi:DNA-binding response OmpR family regulator